MCRWLDHSFDPQEESREHHNPEEWSNKQRKDLTTHGRVAVGSMTCESSKGKLPEVAQKVYKTALHPSNLGSIHQAYLPIKASLHATNNHTTLPPNNQYHVFSYRYHPQGLFRWRASSLLRWSLQQHPRTEAQPRQRCLLYSPCKHRGAGPSQGCVRQDVG